MVAMMMMLMKTIIIACSNFLIEEGRALLWHPQVLRLCRLFVFQNYPTRKNTRPHCVTSVWKCCQGKVDNFTLCNRFTTSTLKNNPLPISTSHYIFQFLDSFQILWEFHNAYLKLHSWFPFLISSHQLPPSLLQVEILEKKRKHVDSLKSMKNCVSSCFYS